MPTFAPAPVAFIAVLLLCFEGNSEAATTVVTRDFVIACAASAPPTTVLAAQELRRVIARSTGSELRLTGDIAGNQAGFR